MRYVIQYKSELGLVKACVWVQSWLNKVEVQSIELIDNKNEEPKKLTQPNNNIEDNMYNIKVVRLPIFLNRFFNWH